MFKPEKNTCLILIFSLIFWSGTAFPATTLLSSDQQSVSHPLVKSVEHFGQLVSQRTNGELLVVVKPDSMLGGELDVLRKVQEGTQAMARVNLGSLGNQLPAAEIASLPYLFRSSEHMWRVMNGEFGQRMDAEMEKAGYIRLMYLESGSRDFYCKKPIRSQSDLVGLKIRILQSKVFEDLITNLGAKPVSIPFNKVGEALRSGEVDCAEGGIVAFVMADHYKYANYLTQDEHLLMPEVLLMSKKIWDTLSPAQQKILKTAGVESAEYMTRIWKDQESNAIATARKAGVTIIPRNQISMTGIESQAIKTYNKYIKNTNDLETVMKIVTSK